MKKIALLLCLTSCGPKETYTPYLDSEGESCNPESTYEWQDCRTVLYEECMEDQDADDPEDDTWLRCSEEMEECFAEVREDTFRRCCGSIRKGLGWSSDGFPICEL